MGGVDADLFLSSLRVFQSRLENKICRQMQESYRRKVIVPIASTISRSSFHRYLTRYLVRFITRGTKTASVIPGKRELSALIVFEHGLSRHKTARMHVGFLHVDLLY